MHHIIENIVSFEVTEDKKCIDITENCDYFYSEKFNKKDFKLLIDKLTELYEQMD